MILKKAYKNTVFWMIKKYEERGDFFGDDDFMQSRREIEKFCTKKEVIFLKKYEERGDFFIEKGKVRKKR